LARRPLLCDLPWKLGLGDDARSMNSVASASVWAKFAINLDAFIEIRAAKRYQAALKPLPATQKSQRRGARKIDP
jgi:hypothetical protein